ncbi:MAG: bifunctional demethylmenaquinone methyltransferase/2-methoxy-6-polyprenyl-1,4-benzoquinol methylase UbiE [Undibacterium sp.]|nr:bifunctional demethylmenaquinone methyltransferase/2-methoxy-6-polyprenyl-1,4-benzoquinol methylase UbiE [Opitutaceae bacterium]
MSPITPDPKAVNSMFGRIAARYDLANRLLSGGIDLWWRRSLVRGVRRHAPAAVLDLATGSGDVAFALARGLSPDTRIVGMDFCLPMLDEASAKQIRANNPRYSTISFKPGDGLDLPLGDATFDAVTISFGLRNMADRHRALSEMRRVLRPGGRLWVLEFSQPQRWFRPFYFFYLRRILPWIAGTVTGDRDAYVYLNETIEQFPDREALAAEIQSAGFTSITSNGLTFGIVALHEAQASGNFGNA